MAYYESKAGYNAGLPTLKRWLENRNNGKTFDTYFMRIQKNSNL